MPIQSGTLPRLLGNQDNLLSYNPTTNASKSDTVSTFSYCPTRGVKRSASVLAEPRVPFPEESANPSTITTQVKTTALVEREQCSSLSLTTELGDQIRKEVIHQLQTCETCPVFFVTNVCKIARFTKSAKQRMHQDDISKSDIDNAFSVSEGNSKIGKDVLHYDRYYFVNNPKINRHLNKLTHQYSPDHFKHGIRVFKYLSQFSNRWKHAFHDASEGIPLPLVNARYIQITRQICGIGNGDLQPCLSANREKYISDEIARRFSQTLNVFYHALKTPMTDYGKVTFLSDLMSLEAPDHSREEDAGVNLKKQKFSLSAGEFLLRIRYAPGGPEYLTLCEKHPQYK